jgi:hypothetical protein
MANQIALKIFFKLSVLGVDEALDLDGAHWSPGDLHLLVSFGGSGTLDGVAFDDEDILELTPSRTWSLFYDASAHHGGWPVGADLEAVMVPELHGGCCSPQAWVCWCCCEG